MKDHRPCKNPRKTDPRTPFCFNFETPKEEVKRISKIIAEQMSGVAKSELHSFSIPLTVDLNIGDNWGALH